MGLEIESAYEAKKYEDSIYAKWLNSGVFRADEKSGKEPYLICMPPPNATGVLHLGHATMLALEDVMIRFERMRGKEVLWLPGTDHAAIATQSVVEKSLVEKGFFNPRKELGREKLLEEIRSFVEESKDCIRGQVKKMGSSCDWSREKYTLDPEMNFAVNTCFERMFEDGLIYRGGRIVNWDPKMQTTVADDELEYVDEATKFYYFQYGPFVIGTARPETKFCDKYVLIHPDDERYKEYEHGQEFECEWINGKITATIIKDSVVDPEFGTGVMTITPWHSVVDFEIAQRHGLDMEQIIDFNGVLNAKAGEFEGMKINQARAKIVEKLDAKGLVVKIEDYEHRVAVSYRGKGVIEPQVMRQWFVDVNKKVIDWKGEKRSIKEVMADTVRSGMIEIVPSKFDKTYFHWIDNLRDWCISRQVIWGHQIPVWYKVSAEQYEMLSAKPDATSLDLEILGGDFETVCSETKPEGDFWFRDPDTLDTWFSSAMWTFATLGWPNISEELKYFHPSAVLETGYDILFFWVARMILASTYCLRRDGFAEENSLPFKTVYLHGLVRDREGKKMSKSRPETCIDPLDMIEKYGADALRLSLLIGSTPGNDVRLYEEKIAGYRNFVNKIWNGSRFALMNANQVKSEKLKVKSEDLVSLADSWIVAKLEDLIGEVTRDLEGHRFSDAGTKVYEFFWQDYCDWYLEISKGAVNEKVLLHVLRTLLKLMHPFVPFVTEKLWEFMDEGLLVSQEWPEVDNEIKREGDKVAQMEVVIAVISEIRRVRAEAKVEAGKKIKAVLDGGEFVAALESQREAIMRLARLSELEIRVGGEAVVDAKSSFVAGVSVYLPLEGMVDAEAEKARVATELAKIEKEIEFIEGKLSNEGFVKGAPAAVVEKERGRLEELKVKRGKLG